MKKHSSIKSQLYKYSQKYIPYKLLEKIGLKNITPVRLRYFFVLYGPAVILSACVLLILRFLNVKIVTNSIFLQFAIFIAIIVVVGFLIDLAGRTVEIKKLKKREKVYAQTFTELHDEYVKAREEIKARDEFLSIASHELKIPLTSMLLKLHNMLNNVRNISLANFSVPELMRVLENAEQQIRSLTAMINDLLNVSLITTGRMDLKSQSVDLVAITKQVKESFSEILESNNYLIKINAESPVIGYWDRTRIEQAITNLFSNAIKYGQNKPIDIKVFSSGGMGKFIIHDQGIGIPHEKQKVLFDRFKRAVSSEDYEKGLGVGLYITNQIVKAHGGKIKIFSIPTRGSTFTLELPLKN